MRRALVVGLFAVFLLSAAGGSAASGTSAVSGASGGWANGLEAVLPAGNVGYGWLGSVSCASAGNCTAVGEYDDPSGGEGFMLTETGGVWAAGVKVQLPANGQSNHSLGVGIGSVSCTSPGNCTAVGTYSDSSNSYHGLLLTETGGVWAAGIEAPLPANAESAPGRQYVLLFSVSCASAGNCTAVGSYVASGTTGVEGLLLSESGGVWSAAEAPLPANARTTDQSVQLNSVSCASPGNCSAVGIYDQYQACDRGCDRTYRGLLLTETDGVWGTGVEPVLPPQGDPEHVMLNSVSCASAGDCSAVGYYNGYRGDGLLLTESAGVWGTGVKAGLPADALSGASVDSVSCPSAGNCTAVGGYDPGPGGGILLLTETAGHWATGVRAKGIYVPIPEVGPRGGSVSCSSVGNCSALANVGGAAYLLTETAGQWSSGVLVSLPANYSGGYDAFSTTLVSISCTAPGECGAVGTYLDPTDRSHGLLLDSGPGIPRSTLTVTTSGKGGGVLSLPEGIHCGPFDSPVCVFDFRTGTPVTLTPVLVDGTFRGWSGACSGTGDCKVTLSADTTVNAEFALPPCLVPKIKGETLTEAKRTISFQGCTVGKIKHAPSRTIRKGRVISQKPKPGKQLEHGAKINFTVSTGARPLKHQTHEARGAGCATGRFL